MRRTALLVVLAILIGSLTAQAAPAGTAGPDPMPGTGGTAGPEGMAGSGGNVSPAVTAGSVGTTGASAPSAPDTLSDAPLAGCAHGAWQHIVGPDQPITVLAGAPNFDRVLAGTVSADRAENGLWSGRLVDDIFAPVAEFKEKRLTDAVIGPPLSGDTTRAWVSLFDMGGIWGSAVGSSQSFGQRGTLAGWVMHLAASDGAVFAAASKTDGPRGVYRWDPAGGGRWDLKSTTPISLTNRPGEPYFRTLAASPSGSVLWLGTEDAGLWKSTDGGVIWREVWPSDTALEQSSVQTLTVDPRNAERAYVGLGRPGNPAHFSGALGLRVVDGGTTSAYFTDTDQLSAIEVSKRASATVYVGLYGIDGLRVSDDGGSSWRKLVEASPEPDYIMSLLDLVPQANPSCELLFAGTIDGLWVRNVNMPIRQIFVPVLYRNY